MDRLLLVLRWVALAIAFFLNLAAPVPVGFTHEPEAAIVVLALYNGLVTSGLLKKWKPLTPRRALALDTLIFTVGIVASGGWHSSLFVLYFLTILASATYLRSVESLGYTVFVSLTYLVVCTLLPNWDWELTSIEVLVGRVTSLVFIGVVAAAFVRQLEVERRLRRSEETVNVRLKALNELMSLELGSKLNLDKTLEAVARLARRTIGSEFSVVGVFSGEDRSTLSLAFDGVPASKQASTFGAAHLDPIGEVVVRTGKPLLIADVSKSAVSEGGESSFLMCRSLICTPIKLDEQITGVLYNGLKSPDQVDQSQVELLLAMGRLTGLAIANAEMYGRERSNVERLEKLEQMKSEFLSVVSHQLRTPITSIATSADLLTASNGFFTEDQRRLVQNIVRNSTRLDNLVSDLLQMARLKDGRTDLACQPLSPSGLVNDAIAAVRVLMDGREQAVDVRVSLSLPRVEADRRKVEHVLVNLLSNACKFTQRQGGIAVEASEDGEWVQFAVRDNGPGMDREAQERAFEAFYSANGPEGKGGTGLGLAIAKGLVELHGGEIRLESAPGAGTTVYFTLPISR